MRQERQARATRYRILWALLNFECHPESTGKPTKASEIGGRHESPSVLSMEQSGPTLTSWGLHGWLRREQGDGRGGC
jgi:hypothetical protein